MHLYPYVNVIKIFFSWMFEITNVKSSGLLISPKQQCLRKKADILSQNRNYNSSSKPLDPYSLKNKQQGINKGLKKLAPTR